MVKSAEQRIRRLKLYQATYPYVKCPRCGRKTRSVIECTKCGLWTEEEKEETQKDRLALTKN